MVRVLEGVNNELRMAVLDTLCSLVVQLGSDFAIFVPLSARWDTSSLTFTLC